MLRRLVPQARRFLPSFQARAVGNAVPYDRSVIAENDSATSTAAVPSEADVVVIGGGAQGCSTLYHLAKLGVTNTVLIEKDQLTAGTTWHTAGLIWNLRPNDVEIAMLKASRDLMTQLEQETGVDPGWVNNGGLFIASNKERLEEYLRLHTIGKAYGVPTEVLGPKETKKLYPLMNVDDIYATLYSPTDGIIDPAGYCTALSRAATNAGAKVLTGCGVTGIDTAVDDHGKKHVTAVHTDRGTVKAKAVVNAAGCWAPQLGAMAGVKVPLVAMHHAYIVTDTIEGIRDMPNVRDHDASVYLKLQGDALSIGGYEPNPVFWDNVDPNFHFGLFDLDWDVFSQHIEGAVNRVPATGQSGVKSTVCGPESFTSDHKPLLGEDPDVRGYFHNCGYNSSGMMLSGGCGEQLAYWITEGRPRVDMFTYDIRRFSRQQVADPTWCRERSHEAYTKNYAIVFTHDEPLASRNFFKDSLYEDMLAAGCVFQEKQGWERPGWFRTDGAVPKPLPYDYYGNYGHEKNEPNPYADSLFMDYTFDFPEHHALIEKESLKCREQAALFNMSYFGQIFITGPDAQAATDWLFTNNLNKNPGTTVYTCMLNGHGGVESDLTVSVLDQNTTLATEPHTAERGFYVACSGAASTHVRSHMMNEIQDKGFNCQLHDLTYDMGLLSLQGPNSREILQKLVDTPLDNEAFPFGAHKVVTIAGEECRAIRLTFVGELGWELHAPMKSLPIIYRAIMKAGKNCGIVNAGYRAIDALSAEKGYRHWHGDVRPDDTPLEAGLGFTCRKQGAPYKGQEVVDMQRQNGMVKRLMTFTLSDNIPLFGLELVWRDGEIVGYVRRGDYAFTLDCPIAFGYISRPDGHVVKKDWLESGNYEIECAGKRYRAVLHMKSPFDPKNNRVKGIYDWNEMDQVPRNLPLEAVNQ